MFGGIGNMFGSIAGNRFSRVGGLDFIPANSKGDIIKLTDRGNKAQWLGLKSPMMQYWAYQYCCPLASVIDRLADADSNGKLKIIKNDATKEASKSEYAKRMMKLLKRPNPMQTWKQFRAQQVVYKKIFGYCPVLPIMPAGMKFTEDPSYATSLWNLPPWLCVITPTRKMFGQTSMRGIIDKLEINGLGDTVTLTGDQFFTVDDGYMSNEMENYLTPISKMVGLDWAVSNVLAAMEADNVLLKKKGPLGFISHDAAATKDSVAGYIPMSVKEKKELQDNLSEYGMTWDQFQYVISRQAVKWNPISYNVKELMTKETVKQGIEMICDRYGYPFGLLSNAKGTTYSNQDGQKRDLYQDNVIINNESDIDEYNFYFKMEENGITLVSDFNHLPIMQEDENRASLALKARTDAVINQYKAKAITLNRMRVMLGQPTVEGDDTYFDGPMPGTGQTQTNTGAGNTTPQSERAKN